MGGGVSNFWRTFLGGGGGKTFVTVCTQTPNIRAGGGGKPEDYKNISKSPYLLQSPFVGWETFNRIDWTWATFKVRIYGFTAIAMLFALLLMIFKPLLAFEILFTNGTWKIFMLWFVLIQFIFCSKRVCAFVARETFFGLHVQFLPV
jgi:hypothetical protein